MHFKKALFTGLLFLGSSQAFSDPTFPRETFSEEECPAASPVLKVFPRAVGTWDETYMHMDKEGHVLQRHKATLQMKLEGNTWRQVNTYTYEDGTVKRLEFTATVNDKGCMVFTSGRIKGKTWETGANMAILVAEYQVPFPFGQSFVEQATLVDDKTKIRTHQRFNGNEFVGVSLIVGHKVSDDSGL